MKRYFKFLAIVFSVCCLLLVPVDANAGSRECHITGTQTYANSSTLGCNDYLTYKGINSYVSVNNLYFELYEPGTLYDSQFYSLPLIPGTGDIQNHDWYYLLNQYPISAAKVLYIHLDPEGPNIPGCVGAAYLESN